MKTRLFKFLILSILFSTSGCKKSNDTSKSEISKAIETTTTQQTDPREELRILRNHLDTPFRFQNSIPTKFDFCNTKEAILPKAVYNRVTGIANFSIPMPKGFNLSFIKKENDTLYFEINGHGRVDYSGKDLMIHNKTITGLPRGDFNKKLWVTVTFKNYKLDSCSETRILGEKKKTSEVTGSPK